MDKKPRSLSDIKPPQRVRGATRPRPVARPVTSVAPVAPAAAAALRPRPVPRPAMAPAPIIQPQPAPMAQIRPPKRKRRRWLAVLLTIFWLAILAGLAYGWYRFYYRAS